MLGDAELRGLLHDELHPVALERGHGEHEIERRLGPGGEEPAETGADAVSGDLVEDRLELRSRPVEDPGGVAGAKAQHLTGVVCRVLGQDHTGTERGSRDVEAGGRHGTGS
jgi:hypothetical protein